jgi:molybdate transport system substrate-binding protein
VNRKFKTALSIASAIFVLAAAFLILPARRTAAQTAELHVMTSDGMKPSVEEMTPLLERAAGRKVAAQFDSSNNLKGKIMAGEPFDAAVITADVLDGLIQQGKIVAASRHEISRTGIGVGVRAGAPKPDISTVEAFKRTLLKAKSVSFNPSGASAVHIYDMFARMGITDAMKPKLILDAEAGRPQKNVAEGKADLVVTLVPEIKFFPGVELVGPVPAEIQSYVNFAAGVATNARDAEGAKKLVEFLASPAAAPILKAKGMEPHK